jgi:hypothetical protein
MLLYGDCVGVVRRAVIEWAGNRGSEGEGEWVKIAGMMIKWSEGAGPLCGGEWAWWERCSRVWGSSDRGSMGMSWMCGEREMGERDGPKSPNFFVGQSDYTHPSVPEILYVRRSAGVLTAIFVVRHQGFFLYTGTLCPFWRVRIVVPWVPFQK